VGQLRKVHQFLHGNAVTSCYCKFPPVHLPQIMETGNEVSQDV